MLLFIFSRVPGYLRLLQLCMSLSSSVLTRESVTLTYIGWEGYWLSILLLILQETAKIFYVLAFCETLTCFMHLNPQIIVFPLIASAATEISMSEKF